MAVIFRQGRGREKRGAANRRDGEESRECGHDSAKKVHRERDRCNCLLTIQAADLFMTIASCRDEGDRRRGLACDRIEPAPHRMGREAAQAASPPSGGGASRCYFAGFFGT
jgi:hypothetical protein